MPKLRRRLRLSQPASQITTAIIHNTSTESSGISQASSSQSFRDDKSILGELILLVYSLNKILEILISS